jgi:hypothetical protein
MASGANTLSNTVVPLPVPRWPMASQSSRIWSPGASTGRMASARLPAMVPITAIRSAASEPVEKNLRPVISTPPATGTNCRS